MSDFDTDKMRSASRKIVLAEIAFNVIPVTWINAEPGVWCFVLTPDPPGFEDDYGVEGHYLPQTDFVYPAIKKVSVDGTRYTKCLTYADMVDADSSYYYDPETTKLYIHIAAWGHPRGKDIAVQPVYGFCNQVDPATGGYYNDIFYQPRIKDIPSVKKSKDTNFFGIMEFTGGSISFVNDDGFFDTFKDQDIYGQPVMIFFGFGGYAYDEFQVIFTGYIERMNRDFSSFKLDLIDGRKYLSEKIPVNKVTLEDWPFLNESDSGKFKPIAYGAIRNAEPICLNQEETSPTFYEYLFMDTAHHPTKSLDAVYVIQDETALEVTPASVDLDAGTFQLSEAIVSPDDSLLKVTCDFHGADIKNGLAVARDLLLLYQGIPFTEDYFDTGEWITAESRARDIGLYISEDKELSEVLGEISRDTDSCIYPTDDGRTAARRYTAYREIVRLIAGSEWINDPEFEYPSDQYLSSCVIKYDKDRSNSEYRSYNKDDLKAAIYARYRVYKEEEIETNLTTETDAIDKAITVMALSRTIPEIVTRSLKVSGMGIEIMDFVIAEYERQRNFQLDERDKSWHIFEVLEVDKKAIAGEVALRMRTVRDFPYPTVFFMYGMPLFGMRLMGHKLFGKLIYILDVV